jgi:hypothetical protein
MLLHKPYNETQITQKEKAVGKVMPEKCMFAKRYTLHLNSATSTVMTSNSAQWLGQNRILNK